MFVLLLNCMLFRYLITVIISNNISRKICSSEQRELTTTDSTRADMIWVKSIQDSSSAFELQYKPHDNQVQFPLEFSAVDTDGVICCHC